MQYMDADAFQQRIGVSLNSEKLLMQALTHPSYLNEHPESEQGDNQRLEFLGDAVLAFLAGEWLFHHFPNEPEGKLTRLRATLVRTETLANIALNSGLGEALRLGRGEEEHGGRERPANLCDAYEALIGALFLDQGVDAVRQFVVPHFKPVLSQFLQDEADKDAKSRLQEWSQQSLGLTPSYALISASGPDHAKEFIVEVSIGDRCYGKGAGRRKQQAEQAAAANALATLLDENQSS
jgi:ribonuclease-3